jgi:hypothetical protein
MPFAIEIAEELGIPALSFVPFSAFSHLAMLAVPKLVEQGQIPSRADDPVSGVLGMEGFLRPRDLPHGHSGGTGIYSITHGTDFIKPSLIWSFTWLITGRS